MSPKNFAHPQNYFSSTFSERGGRDESKNVKKFEIGPQMRCVETKTCFYLFLGKMTVCHVGEIDEARLFQQSRLFIPAMGPQWKLLTLEKKILYQNIFWGLCTAKNALFQIRRRHVFMGLVKQNNFHYILSIASLPFQRAIHFPNRSTNAGATRLQSPKTPAASITSQEPITKSLLRRSN